MNSFGSDANVNPSKACSAILTIGSSSAVAWYPLDNNNIVEPAVLDVFLILTGCPWV